MKIYIFRQCESVGKGGHKDCEHCLLAASLPFRASSDV